MSRALRRVLPAAAALLAGCASFEDEDIVIDTRVLAMRADLPEQVVTIDLEDPPEPGELLAQLVPTEVCALIADPAAERRLRWDMTLCVFDSNERCDSLARVQLGGGVIEDPELALPRPMPCVTIAPDGNLLGVLLESLESELLSGLAGVSYGVSLTFGPESANPADDAFAGKRLLVAPRLPAERVANTNPALERIDVRLPDEQVVPFVLGRCVDQAAPLVIAPGQRIRLTPVEPAGVRETYTVPTLDGSFQTFTEALTYQWLASAGDFSSGSTGGPRDVAGNPAPLFTDYRAPAAEDVTGPLDVALWIVQRDERLGSAWFEGCVRVVP